MQLRTDALRALALAAGTLSVVRVPVRDPVTPADLRASTAWYPVVGLALAAFPTAALLLPLPALPRAALALALWVAVTGALHLDGWADCCDAAFAPPRATPEETLARRHAILKDPHVGVFGVAGIVILLLAKLVALAEVGAAAPLVAVPLGRWVMVYALRSYPSARADGLAAAIGRAVPLSLATAAAALVLVPLTVFSPVPVRIAVAVSLGILVALTVVELLAARFGGVTGDVLGAAGEAAELAVLWAFLPWGSA
jgi:adenosylcobinamide-GDP ribazoletransferase